MLITVIIPTYNRAQLLSRALDSVLQQSYQALQIICVDDGSTDDTEKLLRNHYPQVQYLSTAQRGVSYARNYAVKAADGECLAFLDSDDQWLPHKLQVQVDALKQHPDAVLCHSEEIWYRHGVRVNPMQKHKKLNGWIYEACLSRCMISPSSVVMSKSIFNQLGGFNPEMPACEDYDLWLRLCARYPVLLCPEPLLIKYGGHADQLSKKYCAMDRFRVQALLNMQHSKHLTMQQRQMTYRTLCEKLDILISGAEKRAKFKEAEAYSLQLQQAKQLQHI